MEENEFDVSFPGATLIPGELWKAPECMRIPLKSTDVLFVCIPGMERIGDKWVADIRNAISASTGSAVVFLPEGTEFVVAERAKTNEQETA